MENQPKTIPKFANEAEEREYWEQHDSSDYLDWGEAESVVMPNLKPTNKAISYNLPKHLLELISVLAGNIA